MRDVSKQDGIGPLDGVFLDFYGTVAGGDRQAVQSICQAVVEDHGIDLTGEELAKRWGLTYFAAIEACDAAGFQTLAEIERDTLVEAVEPLAGRIDPRPYVDRLNQYLAQPDLFDEVHEVLDGLGLPICIVSNADDAELRAALQHHGLRFDHVVTSESARCYKPDPEIFRIALKRTGWSPDRVIHVGDSLHSDVAGAHRAGIRAAWLHRTDRISDIGTETPEFTWPDLRPILGLTNGQSGCLD
jgi:2-haloacid dehalogenase/putative hydrolase of the HAD superfamily